MAPPKNITELVQRYESNRDQYRSGHYNETQVRLEFLDPFFKALGWDIHNEQGFAEAYKDVIHVDAIKVGGATKAPDYCFRIGGTRSSSSRRRSPRSTSRQRLSPRTNSGATLGRRSCPSASSRTSKSSPSTTAASSRIGRTLQRRHASRTSRTATTRNSGTSSTRPFPVMRSSRAHSTSSSNQRRRRRGRLRSMKRSWKRSKAGARRSPRTWRFATPS
jgi:hypothetical protein